MLDHMMRGMPDIRGHDDDVVSGTKSSRCAQLGQHWMISPGNAQIAAEIEALSPKATRRSREGAQSQIGFAGFELRLEMSGVERYRAQTEPASLTCDSGQKRWKEYDGADIRDQKLEDALGCARLESGCGGAKSIGRCQQVSKRLGHRDGPWGELHRVAVANDQGIAEMIPKSCQNFADGGLGRVEQLRCARQIALAQQNAQRS